MSADRTTGAASDRPAPASQVDDLAVIEQRLVAHGYRMTAPRRQLLASMYQMGDRFDLELLQEAVPTVSRSTAFRTMRLLLTLDLACRVALPDGTIGYRLSVMAPHQHATCIGCGAIQVVRDVVSERLDQVLQRVAASLGYGLIAHRLDVFGYCGNCRQPSSGRSMAEE